MIQIRRILFGTDFSECSEHALGYAFAFAEQHGAELTVAHVVQVPDPYGPYEAWAFNRQSVEAQLLEESRKHIDRGLEGRVPPGVAVVAKALAGIPSRALVALAEEGEFDLVVLGTHGRGAISHLVMGSVAERVVRHAPCPVLTVRHVTKRSDPAPA